MTRAVRPSTGGAVYRRNRALLLSASDRCGICGHPGARTADHIIPPHLWPRDETGKMIPGFDDLANLRPAHGSMGSGRTRVHNRCTVCGRLCNQSRGKGPGPRRPQSRVWFPDRAV
jgi:hypothetical protein